MVYDINRPKDIAASILVNLSLESFTLKETNDSIVRTRRGITHGQELRPTAVGASPLGSNPPAPVIRYWQSSSLSWLQTQERP